jgi:hypothetical protein
LIANVGFEGSDPFFPLGNEAILGWRLSLERLGCVVADQAIPA